MKLAMIFFLFLGHSPATDTNLKVGDTMPDIKLNDPSGDAVNLYSIKKKYVLVDFWASWCGPCRKENPNLVDAYAKYNKARLKDAKGFEIYSISLDTKLENWKSAIKSDNLDWKYHGSDLAGWESRIARKFGIHAIPSNFLIGPDHKIIAINVRGMELHTVMDEYVESL